MTFELRFLVVALAAFATASLIVSSALPWLWRRLAQAPPPRASAILRLRLLPTLVGAAAAMLTGFAYWRFEPRHLSEETVGWLLPAVGGLTMVCIGAAAVRCWWLWRATAREVKPWLATAERIQLPGVSAPVFAVTADFPVVAVFGVFRPRLVVARSVLDACSHSEMQAILAHEERHIRQRDNLRRLVLAAAPDPLALLNAARRVESAWLAAAEDAADDAAAHLGPRGRIALAEALIRVARLVPPGGRIALPASALYHGEDLDRRVRRLLVPPAGPGEVVSAWRFRMGAVLMLTIGIIALKPLHQLVEAAVTFLP